MGLGGAVEGGATVVALLLLAVAVVVGLALLWGVRAGTGRWRPAVLALLAWTAVVAVLPLAAYTSDRSREQRRASALREAVLAAAGVPSRPAYGDHQDAPCYRDGRVVSDGSTGWDAVGVGDAGSPDVLARFDAGLTREGFQTSRGQSTDDYGRTTQYVLGTRGRASALVEQSHYQLGSGTFVLRVEDGCSQVVAPR